LSQSYSKPFCPFGIQPLRRLSMNKTTKPRKTDSKRITKGSVPETPPEPQVSTGPVAAISTSGTDVAEAQSLAVAKPYIRRIPPPPEGYNIPGSGEFGSLAVEYEVYPGDDNVPLGRVEFYNIPRPTGDWGAEIGRYNPSGGGGTFKITFYIRYSTHEARYLAAKLYNKDSPGDKTNYFEFSFHDLTAPTIEILSVRDNAQVPLAPLDVSGIAEDRQSEVAAVEWSLNGSSYRQASSPTDPQNKYRVNWSFQITDLRSGLNTITIRSRDKKGNASLKVVRVNASGDYKPEDDLGSLRAYLKDLILHAATHVKVRDQQLTEAEMTAELTTLFHQPFAQLIDTYDAKVLFANQPVNQLRAAIEVLRKYLDAAPDGGPGSIAQIAGRGKLTAVEADKEATAPSSDLSLSADQPGSGLALFTAPAVTEADYRREAYQALLSRIGTSYEEIRLARGADEETRQALADRLGITLDPGINNQLEKLYLSASAITETNLEGLFGLEDTARNPLTVVAEPDLLRWRRDFLEKLWREQDKADFSAPGAPLPIIDPDLIGEHDLCVAKPPDPAFDLWQARTQWLIETAATLKAHREAQPTAKQGFEIIIQEALGKPVTYLLELADRQKQGTDIAAELSLLHLTQSAFKRLLRVWALVENNTVTDTDWDDVYNILVQARKQQNYAAWRAEETQIALTPSLFQISETVPQLPPWRGTWRARLNWLDTLQARIDQLRTTEDALRADVSAVEEQTLPLLRDALISSLASQPERSPTEVADGLVNWLLVDLKTNASQRTTRLIQGIETVQGLLFALRAGQLAEDHPAASWRLLAPAPDEENPEKHFDVEWQWMGNYATWRAAMFVFFFPDTVLLPSLRVPYDADQPLAPLHRTKYFEGLLKELRKKPRLSPEQARLEAGSYLDKVVTDTSIPIPAILKTAIEATRPPSPPAPPSSDPPPPPPPTFLTDQHTDETLGERRKLCSDVFGTFGTQAIPNYIQEIFYGVPLQLAWQLQKSGEYLAALDWFQTVYAYNFADKPDTPFNDRKIYYGLERETNHAPILSRSDHWLAEELNPHDLAAKMAGSNPYTRYTLMSLARCLMDFADSEFTRDTPESLARARALYLTARRLLLSPDLAKPTVVPPGATVLPNPLLELLQMRVEIQLTKMRQGRNIAGMKRQLELPVSPPPGPNDLPTIGAGGQLIIPGARPALRPTPYYFRVLMERSKQLVNIAQQIEAAYLAALEKLDAENYSLLRANNDLQLAFEGVELQNRRVHEAQAGVGVANAQLKRAQVMSERYSMLSSMGLNAFEQQMVGSYQQAMSLTLQAGAASAAAARLGGVVSAMNYLGEAASHLPNPPTSAGNPISVARFMAAAALSAGSAEQQAKAAILSANAQAAQTNASIAGIFASHEARKLDYETQAAIAEQEIAIGEAQIGAAQAHVGVADQERRIAQTQVTQAQAVADFLARKFTNAELYEWMSGVLGEVYSYFLQQATALAQLAENQLAFERQDTPPKFIQVDYWAVPSESGSLTTDQKAPDRKGLTGSARLLRDLYQLDQYAFETDKRKLNLSQTFSLASMAPFDFEQFRQTGVLTFATPMSLFDHDFPGHYLRLIKRVRTSVIALIPPHHGIRASLIASGISRVVTGGDVFQQIVVRRDPELVALTSPLSATGVFELDVQSDMHLPFESMGVDTFWEFQMPRAANPFDFRTIADVLVTIEYTALNSFDYRQQVIKMLDPKLSGERSYIFTSQFADAWYDLHNPDQSETPMVVKFKTWREEFPPNLEDLKIKQVLLFFSRALDEFAEEEPWEVEVKHLRFTPQGATDPIGGSATSIDGVISTRRGNGTSWISMIGKAPAGEWELSFMFDDPAKNKEIRERFKKGEIWDILLVITYGGRTPAWPL
jgi:hypothetical protein